MTSVEVGHPVVGTGEVRVETFHPAIDDKMAMLIANQTGFSHHEPCPQCGSKDNLGVWLDGHKFCFGCRYWESAPKLQVKPKILPKQGFIPIDDYWNDTVDHLPEEALIWLRKYGITDSEIFVNGIIYHPGRRSIVFPLGSSKTRCYRHIGDSQGIPKAITRGTKTHNFWYHSHHSYPGRGVFVEDCVSAIKVARHVDAYACLGSDVPGDAIYKAIETYKTIGIWLDRDMATKSLKTALTWSSKNCPVYCIVTERDPKEYDDTEIKDILQSAKILPSKQDDVESVDVPQ